MGRVGKLIRAVLGNFALAKADAAKPKNEHVGQLLRPCWEINYTIKHNVFACWDIFLVVLGN